jgi:hypothetical protein
MQCPSFVFKDIIRDHFFIKAAIILRQLDKWPKIGATNAIYERLIKHVVPNSEYNSESSQQEANQSHIEINSTSRAWVITSPTFAQSG